MPLIQFNVAFNRHVLLAVDGCTACRLGVFLSRSASIRQSNAKSAEKFANVTWRLMQTN